MSYCGKVDCYIMELHTHQAGMDGIIGQVCKHQQLARSCEICDLESERDRLKAELELQKETCQAGFMDRDAWKRKAEKMEEALRAMIEKRLSPLGAQEALAEFGEGK